MLESHSGNCSGFVIRRFILREFESHLQHQTINRGILKRYHEGLISLRSWFDSGSRFQILFQSSQEVRQRTVNAPIVGSIPTSGASSMLGSSIG
jgi:hypothetical protein